MPILALDACVRAPLMHFMYRRTNYSFQVSPISTLHKAGDNLGKVAEIHPETVHYLTQR